MLLREIAQDVELAEEALGYAARIVLELGEAGREGAEGVRVVEPAPVAAHVFPLGLFAEEVCHRRLPFDGCFSAAHECLVAGLTDQRLAVFEEVADVGAG